ncbi:MAG: alpha/beta fold hydrolase [Gemmatimonadota bacterium]
MNGWKRLLAGAAAVGIPAALNARIASSTSRLESRLPAERRYYPWDQGYVFYAVRGEGPPLVLVHGVYPGASSHEWRDVLESLSASHRVYALDLLGFGLSDRPRITYDPPLYESLLGDFLQDVVEAPAALCASSLSAAFAAHAAFQRGRAVSRLALVSPTGIYDWDEPPGVANFLVHRALCLPVLGLSGYYALTSRAGLARYLRERLYHDPATLTDERLETHYEVAHQAGASFAPAAFLAGLLNEPLDGILGELSQPVLLVWGRHSRMAPLGNAGGFLALNPASDLEILESSGALPQVEEPARFSELLLAWLARSVEGAPR